MSYFFPASKQELDRAAWAISLLVLVPLLALLALLWSVYLSFEVVARAMPHGMVAGAALSVYMYERERRMAAIGLRHHETGSRVPWSFLFKVTPACTALIAVPWAILATSVADLSRAPMEDRVFTIAELKKCTGRHCGFCLTEARLDKWVGANMDAWFCVSRIDPPVQSGERLRLRGRFAEHVQYVHALGRP
jgi:hypothetical protein